MVVSAQLSQQSTIDKPYVQVNDDGTSQSTNQTTPTQEEAPVASNQDQSAGGTSTSISSSNGQTTVTVNGQAVVENAEGKGGVPKYLNELLLSIIIVDRSGVPGVSWVITYVDSWSSRHGKRWVDFRAIGRDSKQREPEYGARAV